VRVHTHLHLREKERERDIDPHTHTHTRTILLTADRLNQHTLYESKYGCRRESKAKRTKRERNRSAHTHTSIGCTWGDGVLEVHTSIASLTEREKRSSVVCTRKHKSLEPGLSLSRSYQRGYSTAYSTQFPFKSSAKDFPPRMVHIVMYRGHSTLSGTVPYLSYGVRAKALFQHKACAGPMLSLLARILA